MRITDPGLQKKILLALGDVDSPKILYSVRAIPKTAQDISNETDVPLSSLYRKVTALRNAGLVLARWEITPEGKRQDLFLSAVTEIKLKVLGEQIEVDLVPTSENANRIWFKLFNRENLNVTDDL